MVDVLVELQWKNEGPMVVLVHIEVQSQKDLRFSQRLFYYHARLAELYEDRSLLTLAVLADRDPDWKPNSYSTSFAGSCLEFRFPVVKLRDYSSQVFWLTHSRNPFALLTAATLYGQEARADSIQREESKFHMVKALHRLGLSRQEILAFFRLIDAVLSLSTERRMSFQTRVEDYEKEMDMPYITSFEQSGIEKGRAEGRREALLETLTSLLEARFGEPALAVCELLSEVDLEELKSLPLLAATDESLDQFRARLQVAAS